MKKSPAYLYRVSAYAGNAGTNLIDMSCHLPSTKPEEFFQFCEKKNTKLSMKCKILLSVFWDVDDFIDAESLWLLVKSKNMQISRATVYKLLIWLHREGYVVQKRAEQAKYKIFRLDLTTFMSERPLYVL